MPIDFVYRRATAADALTLSTLAKQVFLDTYATNGINTALATEADTVYSPEVFEGRLRDASVELLVATAGEYMVGFVDMAFATNCPVPGVHGAEVFRMYVQRPFLRRGLGRALMAKAEASARARGLDAVWLTAWVGNDRALAFYESLGYLDVGVTQYVIEGVAHENRVLCKRLAASAD
jgi:diamine N-acetyltransferase